MGQAEVVEAGPGPRLFDLNIEEVLDNWEVSHAIREVISNALDEQVLSGSRDIDIFKDDTGDWHVRDFGRGLRIEHFTQNESPEKRSKQSGIIGKFGVGLKDALATFHRRGVGVCIRSRSSRFTLQEASKHNFASISTLHVRYEDGLEDIDGTDFVLEGVADQDMADAKGLFLAFNDEETLERTRYGDILARRRSGGRVYITGVFASDEPNFLFSYNVTDLTESMKKRLNRERLNVGRGTYSERVKAILRSAADPVVHEGLIDQILQRTAGELADEMQWIEISQMALTLLHQQDRVIYVTQQEIQTNPDLIDHARRDGLKVIVVTRAEKAKLLEQAESGGVVTRTLETYLTEFNESFEYRFVDPSQLTDAERANFALTEDLFRLVGVRGSRAPRVLISETMRVTKDDTDGVWDPTLQAIVIKRAQLSSALAYAATLLHEVAHATSGTLDATREFESVLTRYLGRTSTAALERG